MGFSIFRITKKISIGLKIQYCSNWRLKQELSVTLHLSDDKAETGQLLLLLFASALQIPLSCRYTDLHGSTDPDPAEDGYAILIAVM